jgi:hypothetical protein
MALKIVSGLSATSIQLSSFLDLAKGELRNAQIQNLSTTQINAITSPAQGQFVYDSTLDKLKVYDGSAWTLVGAAADESTITLSSNTLTIKDSGVATAKLASLAVTTAKIAAGAVTNAKLGADAVTGAKIADNAIDSEHYTDGSIDTAHIADAQVTGAKIAATTVATGNIVNLAVTSGKLADGAVGTAKLATDAVTTAKIADAQITTALIATDAVTAAKIADNSVDIARLNVTDGTAGQFLKTDGSGTLAFATHTDQDVSPTNLVTQLAALDTTHTNNVHGSGATAIVIGSSTNTPNVQVTGDVIVDGDLMVSGTTTTVNSTTISVADPVFTLGGTSAPSADDNKDRGIEFHYYDSSAARKGFFGYDDSAREFTALVDITNNDEVFSGTLAPVKFGNATLTSVVLPTSGLNYAGTTVTTTGTELNYVAGVTSGIQAQINSKQATITGAATTIVSSNLTASRALVSNSSGKVAVSAVTSTELGYLDGVTSAIQTQLNSKPAAYAADVTTSSGTATIASSAHGLAFPVNVQVYDSSGQLVLVDIRQTVSSGEMTITINAPDATYSVVAIGNKAP